ncbi:MAG TPA: DNA gyrase inhibitor YacG, partial [Terriglobia bacterium]|nr:DNA gyrase inhibitor YacG [Terriglobia bacterium]
MRSDRENQLKCPTCKKETEYSGNPSRPFCSERCKLIDLGKWAA